MLSDILPKNIESAVTLLNENDVYELRIRDDCPIMINYRGKYMPLRDGKNIILAKKGSAVEIVKKAADNSLYSINNEIIQGFITAKNGVRLGVCGEVVFEGKDIKTIKNFTSVNIRVPHAVRNCSEKIYRYIVDGDCVASSLICAPPGKGKTTMLRDLSSKISDSGKNVLIVDERNEIAAYKDGDNYYYVGKNTDVISMSNKKYAFSYALRSMSPEVIVTDELMTTDDAEAYKTAVSAGVKVIASVHAGNKQELLRRDSLASLINNGLVERYVFLSGKNIGDIDVIYNENMARIV